LCHLRIGGIPQYQYISVSFLMLISVYLIAGYLNSMYMGSDVIKVVIDVTERMENEVVTLT